MSVKLSNVSSPYGAPMGRRERHQNPDDHPKFSLRRIPINGGGYDSGGAYWGLGEPLYWYSDENGETSAYLRAPNREAAKAKVRKDYPGARFYR